MKRVLSWLMVGLFAAGSMAVTAAWADDDNNGRHLGWYKKDDKQYKQWAQARYNDNRWDDRRYSNNNRYTNSWWNNQRNDRAYDQRIDNLRARLERQENVVERLQDRVDEFRRRDRTRTSAYREALSRLRQEQAQYQQIRGDLQRYISKR